MKLSLIFLLCLTMTCVSIVSSCQSAPPEVQGAVVAQPQVEEQKLLPEPSFEVTLQGTKTM